jgi:hypothetical protein
MSNKNILQEYCQKEKFAMPTYVSRSEGKAHDLQWYCKIKIADFNLEMESTVPSNSKVNAEQLVAGMALESINGLSPNKSNIITSPTIDSKLNMEESNAIYLIDLENTPAFNKKLNPNNLYVGFHNNLHHSIPKYADWHECSSFCLQNEISISQSNKLLYLIEGGVADLVDHFMTMFTCPLVSYLQTNTKIQIVYIVSGDRAAFCTKACLEKALEWSSITGITIKNLRSV